MEAGKRVLVESHGEGTVVSVRNDYATIQFDRGYTYEYDLNDLQELSKDTLKRYVVKASKSAATHGIKAADSYHSAPTHERGSRYGQHMKQAKKRLAGIATAAAKLEEGVDPIKGIKRAITGQGSGLVPRSKEAKRTVGNRYMNKLEMDRVARAEADRAAHEKDMSAMAAAPSKVEKAQIVLKGMQRASQSVLAGKTNLRRKFRAIDWKHKY